MLGRGGVTTKREQPTKRAEGGAESGAPDQVVGGDFVEGGEHRRGVQAAGVSGAADRGEHDDVPEAGIGAGVFLTCGNGEVAFAVAAEELRAVDIVWHPARRVADEPGDVSDIGQVGGDLRARVSRSDDCDGGAGERLRPWVGGGVPLLASKLAGIIGNERRRPGASGRDDGAGAPGSGAAGVGGARRVASAATRAGV